MVREDPRWPSVLRMGWRLEIPQFVSTAHLLSDSIRVTVRSKFLPAMKRAPSQVDATLSFNFSRVPLSQANEWVVRSHLDNSKVRCWASPELRLHLPRTSEHSSSSCSRGGWALYPRLPSSESLCFPFGELSTWPHWGYIFYNRCVLSASNKLCDLEHATPPAVPHVSQLWKEGNKRLDWRHMEGQGYNLQNSIPRTSPCAWYTRLLKKHSGIWGRYSPFQFWHLGTRLGRKLEDLTLWPVLFQWL